MQAGVREWQSAGHAAVCRCEAVDAVGDDKARNDELERELQQLIPQPGSSSESAQLRRLRDIQSKAHQTGAEVATGGTDGQRRSVTWERGADGERIETELLWSGRRLIWSRSKVVVRAFSYGEHVKSACWAWMDSDSTWERHELSTPPAYHPHVSQQAHHDHHNSRTAHQVRQTPNAAAPTNPVSHLQQSFRQTPTARKAQKRRRLFRALCVFLPSCLVIYHPHSGREFIKRLDLSVSSVFALSVGLLIQRSAETEDRRRADVLRQGVSGADPPLSTLFYLRRPYDELKPVELVSGILFSRHDNPSKSLSASLPEGEKKAGTFNEVDERVVFVSSVPPLLVAASVQGKCVRIYAYAHDRAPFAKYQAGKPAKAGDNGPTRQDIPMARRATMDGQRSRSGAKPKLPSRKSARLESSSSRSSMAGPRSSLATDRSRTSSGTGHARRLSGGLPPLYGQSALLHEKEEQTVADEENMQEMMQLLDEFDEVDEDNGPQRQAPPAGPSGPATRRRTSRAFAPTPASTSAAPTALATVANTIRTPFVKARPTEERKSSRARKSMPAGSATESNVVSLAMELSQKDEASRLAMNANGDKTISKSLVSVTPVSEEQTSADGLSIFQDLAQGFAAMTLLEQVAVPELQSLEHAASVKAFVLETDGMTLLYLVLPFCSKLLSRQIVEAPLQAATSSFTLAARLPPPRQVDAEVRTANAFVLRGKARQDILLVEPALSSRSGHLVAGPPGPSSLTCQIDLGDEFAAKQSPLHLDSDHSSQEPRCRLTSLVLAVCEVVLKPSRFRQLRVEWIRQQPVDEESEWAILIDLLVYGAVRQLAEPDLDTWKKLLTSRDHKNRLSHLFSPLAGLQVEAGQRPQEEKLVSSWTRDELTTMVMGLNLIAQDARLDVCERMESVPRLAALIAAFAARLCWWPWLDYWARLTPCVAGVGAEASLEDSECPRIFDVYNQASLAMQGTTLQVQPDLLRLVPRLKTVLEVFSSFSGDAPPFETMSGALPTTANRTAKAVVERMLQCKLGTAELRRLPFSLALPLQEAIKACQDEAPSIWSAEAYTFVGREDLAREISPEAVARIAPTSILDTGPTSLSSDSTSSRLFPNDYRLKEVMEMLQTSRPVATKGPDVASMEDQEVIAEQQKRVFVSASDRIKTLSVGRGMYSLSSIPYKSTEQWKTAAICLRIRMLNNCIIQHREPDSEGAEMEWPEFHNGVASALQLAIAQDKIESSWLYSQLNKEFTSRHAGLMFGIGLLGQLRHLGKIHAHFYLSTRHSITTIGLLLGISLSFMGSCDAIVKALVSIHLTHTLPVHSRPLKTSMLEQSAALVGLGFVFLASKDRWASRMAFKAIGTESVMTDDSQMLKRECFSLSAALSLGLTCLGKGREAGGLGSELEKDIIPGLERLIKSFSSNASSEEQQTKAQGRSKDDKRYTSFEWKPEIFLTTTPASIALALIYLKSNRSDKVAKLPLPESAAQLDEIRPDMLLIRALCRSLIAWDAIRPSSTWLNSTLPTFVRFGCAREVKEASESCQLAYWSLRLGGIFAIGLKYAGSNDVQARACLMDELHHFQSQVDIRPATYFEKIRHQTLQSSVDVILTCLSMVLAGTGDIEVLQFLRRALYKVDTLRYGNYMATSMSIGMLFLGAGRFTLSTSDSAIAALLIAFYPRYPISAQDNRCHLQAYRHLWLLAVEARLLSVEDVKSGESSTMDVEMRMAGEQTASVTLTTPCLFPKLEEMDSIRVASLRYFPCKLDLRGNARHRRTMIETRKLYVKKRAAEMSHDQDKWGKASIASRARGTVVCNRLPLQSGNDWSAVSHAQRLKQADELRRLIKDNTLDKDIHTLVDAATHGAAPRSRVDQAGGRAQVYGQEWASSALEVFVLQSILDCILHDNQALLPTFLSLYSSTQALLNESNSEQQQHQLCFLKDMQWIQAHRRAAVTTNTTTALDCNFLDSLMGMLCAKMMADASADGLKPALVKYARLQRPSPQGSLHENDTAALSHTLAGLFVVAEVPPLPTLLQLKLLVSDAKGSGSVGDLNTMQALARSVFNQAGFNTASEVLNVFVQTWWEE